LTAERGLLTSQLVNLFQVIIDYWLLLLALTLLWLPRHGLHLGRRAAKSHKVGRGSSVRRKNNRDERAFQDSSAKLKAIFSKPRNWIDLFRAAAGGIAVTTVCFRPEMTDNLAAGQRLVVISQCVVMVVAVLIQTVRYDGKLTLFAPVFFVTGLSFGLVGWQAALFAFVTIWIVDLVLSSLSALLVCYAMILLVYGFLLPHPSMAGVFLAAALPLLPVILSATTKRRLSQPAKATKPATV
jgi:hypothetical protein